MKKWQLFEIVQNRRDGLALMFEPTFALQPVGEPQDSQEEAEKMAEVDALVCSNPRTVQPIWLKE